MLAIIPQETGRDRTERSGRDDLEQETPLIFLCGLSEEIERAAQGRCQQWWGGELKKPMLRVL